MAKKHQLEATHRNRSGSGALKQMRREGLVPAVIYGTGTENENIKVDAKVFSDLLHQSVSESILVDLDIQGKKRLALIQDVQHNPLNNEIVHVDFLAVNENELITAVIPVEAVGIAAGVKAGGILDVQLHDLEIQCLPKDLPEIIEVDVSALQLGQALHLGEVSYPEGVKPTMSADVVLAIISEPRVKEASDDDAPTEPVVLKEKAPKEAAGA